MNKLLTISIAAYNIEDYIEQAIKSCISKKSIDEIEVLIMNDGSKDRTAEISQKYADKYPQSITLVNKENGGYGTNVTMALSMAKGKYFRLLDGDDFLVEGCIDKYVELLRNQDNDIVITAMNYYFENEAKTEYHSSQWQKLCGETYDIDDLTIKYSIPMWNITVKTECIKKTYQPLPPHTLYTDQLFIYYAFKGSRNICFESLPVYCYRIGREGQSIEDKQRMKHWEDTCKVFNILLYDYSIRGQTNPLMDKRIEIVFSHVIRVFLLFPPEKKWLKLIKEYDLKIKKSSKKLYKNTWWTYKKITILRLTGYTAYRLLAGRGGWY